MCGLPQMQDKCHPQQLCRPTLLATASQTGCCVHGQLHTQPVSPHQPCLSFIPSSPPSCSMSPAASSVTLPLLPPPSPLHLIHACLAVQVQEVLLPSGATRVSLSARKPFTAVVSLQSGAPVVVELSEDPVLTPLDTNINLKGGYRRQMQQHPVVLTAM